MKIRTVTQGQNIYDRQVVTSMNKFGSGTGELVL